jgi:hypothetical protein
MLKQVQHGEAGNFLPIVTLNLLQGLTFYHSVI